MSAAATTRLTPYTRFVLTPPEDTRPSLIVQLCPDVGAEVLADLRKSMLAQGCPNGLAVDDLRFVILRDSYGAMGPESIAEEAELETPKVIPGVGSLDVRLERWLEMLSKNWNAAVPREKWAAALLTDIVPAAAGTFVRRTMGGGNK